MAGRIKCYVKCVSPGVIRMRRPVSASQRKLSLDIEGMSLGRSVAALWGGGDFRPMAESAGQGAACVTETLR